MSVEKTKIGIIGCGNIIWAYGGVSERCEILDLAACADMQPERAVAAAEQYGIRKACSVEELLADPEIEIVINLTPPLVHAGVTRSILEAGKHAYSEKPLTVDREDARELLALAKEKNLLLGCAPDTFLGAAAQTARKLIDDGWIGEPVGASAFMLSCGPEQWHPNPQFHYHPGGGPLFGTGPYYLTHFIHLLGPVEKVTASTRITFKERRIGSEPHRGEIMYVDTPTHVNSILQFANGAVGTFSISFDVRGSTSHVPIEIYGTEGTLLVPDPNLFGGAVRVRRPEHEGFIEVPLSHRYADQNRGLGAADMAYALRSGRPLRASGAMGYHVLDIMHSIYEAADSQQWVSLGSTVERPAAVPVALRPGTDL